MKFAFALLALMVLPAGAQSWMADVDHGQGDALGMAALFFVAFAWIHIRAGFKESEAAGWKAVALCVAVAVAALLFPPVRWLLVLVFLLSFLHFAWNNIKGR